MKRFYQSGLYCSIIGVSTLIFCGIMAYQGKASIMDLSGWFAFAVMMIRANDSLIGLNKNHDE